MVNKNIVIENARIGFKNFAGKEEKYNPAGRRNFCVFLDTDLAVTLEEDGWNIRWLTARDEDEEDQAYMQVALSYEPYPPKIVLITSQRKTILDEDNVNMLDWADIQSVDLIMRPYNWEDSGKVGVKAYLKSMYVLLMEDEFEGKYDEIPYSNDAFTPLEPEDEHM